MFANLRNIDHLVYRCGGVTGDTHVEAAAAARLERYRAHAGAGSARCVYGGGGWAELPEGPPERML